jgi:hypothetical protein
MLIGKTAIWDSPDGPMEAKVHHVELSYYNSNAKLYLTVPDGTALAEHLQKWLKSVGIHHYRQDIVVSVAPDRTVLFPKCHPKVWEHKEGHNAAVVQLVAKGSAITMCVDHLRQAALDAAQEIMDSSDIVTQNSARDVERIAEIIYNHVKRSK